MHVKTRVYLIHFSSSKFFSALLMQCVKFDSGLFYENGGALIWSVEAGFTCNAC